MSAPKITLEEWARRKFDPPPCAETRRRWVRSCRIYPLPEKVGRTYYVNADAEYIDPSDTDTLLDRINNNVAKAS